MKQAQDRLRIATALPQLRTAFLRRKNKVTSKIRKQSLLNEKKRSNQAEAPV